MYHSIATDIVHGWSRRFALSNRLPASTYDGCCGVAGFNCANRNGFLKAIGKVVNCGVSRDFQPAACHDKS
jgi:hypothetical protein